MGKLTDDMTRLKNEIDGLRQSRGKFKDDLRRSVSTLQKGVSEMLGAFRADLTRARRAWGGG